MIVTFGATAPASSADTLLQTAESAGLPARSLRYGDGIVVVRIEGDLDVDPSSLPGIARPTTEHSGHAFASLDARPRSTVSVGGVHFGGAEPVVIAGPCVIDSKEQLVRAALAARSAGATMLRGGAFKPRTSPYAFQGLGEEGLKLLLHASEVSGLPVVTEVLEPEQVDAVAEHAHMLQIGARNMANTPLLKRAGRAGKPILLKRGFAATIEEFLMSAEYLLAAGNPHVVLCERGIRGFDPAVRFNLDLSAVPLLKELTHLPVIVDPSHGTGKRSLVPSMAIAALAAGADGLIIESEPEPDSARCDAFQTIDTADLERIVRVGTGVWRLAKTETPVLTDDVGA